MLKRASASAGKKDEGAKSPTQEVSSLHQADPTTHHDRRAELGAPPPPPHIVEDPPLPPASAFKRPLKQLRGVTSPDSHFLTHLGAWSAKCPHRNAAKQRFEYASRQANKPLVQACGHIRCDRFDAGPKNKC